jgi:hypothetical protein
VTNSLSFEALVAFTAGQCSAGDGSSLVCNATVQLSKTTKAFSDSVCYHDIRCCHHWTPDHSQLPGQGEWCYLRCTPSCAYKISIYQATFLTAEERQLVLDRINVDRSDANEEKMTKAGVFQQLRDWKIWTMVSFACRETRLVLTSSWFQGFLFLCSTLPSYGRHL